METKGTLTYEEDTCRICMAQQSGVIDINSSISNKSARIIDMIRFCFDIELVIHDALPNFICNECALHLNVAFNLKGKCLQTEKFFLNFLNLDNLDSKTNLLSLLQPTEPPNVEPQPNNAQKAAPPPPQPPEQDPVPQTSEPAKPTNDADDAEPAVKYIRPNLMAYFSQDTVIELSDTDSDTDDEGATPPATPVPGRNDATPPPELPPEPQPMDIRDAPTPPPITSHEETTKKMETSEIVAPKKPAKEPPLAKKGTYECPACSLQCNDMFTFNSHVKSHEKKECKVCHKVCINLTGLVNHFRMHRQNLTKIKCPNCDFTSNLKASVITHIRIQHNEGDQENPDDARKPVSCVFCDMHFGKVEEFRMHLKKEHNVVVQNNAEARKHSKTSSTSVLKCGECSRQFKSTNSFAIHMRLHEKSKLQYCYVCKLSFKHNMYLHFKICHPGLPPYKCSNHCNETFTNQKAFLTHKGIDIVSNKRSSGDDLAPIAARRDSTTPIFVKKARYSVPANQFRSSALELPPVGYSYVPIGQTISYECYICDVKLESEALLSEHIDNHEVKKCKKCSRIFGNSRALIGHCKLKHPKVESIETYQCLECGNDFISFGGLKRHQFSHKISAESEIITPDTPDENSA
ncbi:zinc finger protein 808-like [Culicoides brevitarsis]|uniref:zinc finger protein 808-like n=1 Tax=Culicoides brevitarsis TaxID=469753 RepID=UPI00307B708B